MSDDNRGWEFLTGFLLGSMVGAAAALLLAPASGEEVRETLREKGIELRGRGEDLTTEAQQRANVASDEARKRAAEAQERGRLALEEQKSRLQDAIQAGKQAAQQRREELMGRYEQEKNAPNSSES